MPGAQALLPHRITKFIQDSFVFGEKLPVTCHRLGDNQPIERVSRPRDVYRPGNDVIEGKIAELQADALLEIREDGFTIDCNPADFVQILHLKTNDGRDEKIVLIDERPRPGAESLHQIGVKPNHNMGVKVNQG